jgi:glutaredoxin-like protein
MPVPPEKEEGRKMPLIIQAKDKERVRQVFEEGLVDPVRLVMFTQTIECQFCAETRQLVEEVAALSDKVVAEVYNFVTDEGKAQEYDVDKIPAIAIIGARDYGVRYYGIPSGYEFTSLIEDIVDVSRGESGLMPETKKAVTAISEPVHLQVFVTPT